MSGVIAAAAIGAATTIYSANKQASATKKAASAQRAATEAQSRSAAVETARERMKQIREARIRSAAISGGAASAGMGQASSGVAGSIASIGSQAGANIGAINVKQGFAEIASTNLQVAADQQAKAAQWQAIGGIGKSIFDQAGGFTTIFGGNTNKG